MIMHSQSYSDYYVYNVDTDTVCWYEKDVSLRGGPPPGFTQRGCLMDIYGHKHLLIFSGLVRCTGNGEPGVASANISVSGMDSTQNSLWALPLTPNTLYSAEWTLLYSNANNDARYWEKMSDTEPCPRYAHQLVATPSHAYLFGGNPGDLSNPKSRLNDFWKIHVVKSVDGDTIRQHLLFLVRQQRYLISVCLYNWFSFKEMCRSGPAVDALKYLQNQVAQVVTVSDSDDFQRLSSLLFNMPSAASVQEERARLYEDKISKYFGEERGPPKHKLQDLLLF